MLPWEFIILMITWAAQPAEIPSEPCKQSQGMEAMRNVNAERPRASGACMVTASPSESLIDSRYASQNGGQALYPRPFSSTTIKE